MDDLHPLVVIPKHGDEHIHVDGRALPFTVLQFWCWSASDLTANALRGIFAEYLVACALGLDRSLRKEWDAFDLVTSTGIKIEVKSAAYLQSWHQVKPSAITFGINATQGYNATTNTWAEERVRQADVYVFALLAHRDKRTLDPLNVAQWRFYVLPTRVLNERRAGQRTISLGSLLTLDPISCDFDTLAATIAQGMSTK